MVVLAIGQGTHSSFASGKVAVERGRIVVDRATGQTSNPKYFAGGDCTNGGREVVDGVADGKRAGVGIAAWLDWKERLGMEIWLPVDRDRYASHRGTSASRLAGIQEELKCVACSDSRSAWKCGRYGAC